MCALAHIITQSYIYAPAKKGPYLTSTPNSDGNTYVADATYIIARFWTGLATEDATTFLSSEVEHF